MWSFDIFDTCLVRRQAFPSDLFLDLAERLQEPLLKELGADFREVFREARVEAERAALNRCGHEEATLQEIWEELVKLVPSLSVEAGVAAELGLEADSLLPIPYTRSLVQAGRQLHTRTAFISDTYLPRDFIEQQLSAHGFLEQDDFLLISSEHRLTKRSGRLFARAIEQIGKPASCIVHHGDKEHSDVQQALKAGLKARHLRQGLLSVRERAVCEKLKHVEPRAASEVVGLLRTSRLSHTFDHNDAARSLVAGFIGPFLLIFATWLLERASADGLKRLYFFSRDCHGLHRVASTLSKNLGMGIECRYLRVSRQSLLLPAVEHVSPAGLPWLRRAWERATVGSVLGKLDLESREIAEELSRSGIYIDQRVETDDEWSRLWTVLDQGLIRSKLMERIDQRRKAALSYFKQEGLLEDVPFGLVDLGWHQSCQAALTRLLRLHGVQARIPAYYLALATGRGAFLTDCPAQAVFHRPPADRRSSRADFELFDRIAILEHLLNCAPHGSVHHYESRADGAGPVEIVETRARDSEIAVKQLLFNRLDDFCQENKSAIQLSDHSTRVALSALLDVFTKSPPGEWAPLVAQIDEADDQNNKDASSLVRPRQWRDLMLDAIKGQDFSSLPRKVTGSWPELSMAGSGPRVSEAYRTLERMNRVRRAMRRTFIG